MKVYQEGLPQPMTTDTKSKLEAASKGFLFALREAKKALHPADQKYWMFRAKKFKAYLQRLGKNLK